MGVGTLKSRNIGAKILVRRSNAMWDKLLETENVVSSLAWNILRKSVRLQAEYMGSKKKVYHIWSIILQYRGTLTVFL